MCRTLTWSCARCGKTQRAKILAPWVAKSEAKLACDVDGYGWDVYEATLYASLMDSTNSFEQAAAASLLGSRAKATAEEQLRDWMAECLAEGMDRARHNEFVDKWLDQALQSSESPALVPRPLLANQRSSNHRSMSHSAPECRLRRKAMVYLEESAYEAGLEVDFDEVRCSISSAETDLHPPSSSSQRDALRRSIRWAPPGATHQFADNKTPQPQSASPLRPGQLFGSGQKANYTGPARKDSVLKTYLLDATLVPRRARAPNKGPLHDSAIDHTPNVWQTL